MVFDGVGEDFVKEKMGYPRQIQLLLHPRQVAVFFYGLSPGGDNEGFFAG